MNLCRTCKHRSVFPHGIGTGTCLNLDAHLRIMVPDRLITTQDFGCVCHQEGNNTANLVSPEEQQGILNEFIGWIQ